VTHSFEHVGPDGDSESYEITLRVSRHRNDRGYMVQIEEIGNGALFINEKGYVSVALTEEFHSGEPVFDLFRNHALKKT